jgi:hypothetical protein
MVRRDAQLVKKPDEGDRILSFCLPVIAKRAKIEIFIARCDYLTTLPHLGNQRRNFRTRIAGQHYIAVEPDNGIDGAGDELH